MYRPTKFALSTLAIAGSVAMLPTGNEAIASTPTAHNPATSTPASASTATDIKDRFAALPGVHNVTELPSGQAGVRFFTMTFTQLSDHRDPRKGTFQQRISIRHRDVSRPTVFFTGGYGLSASKNPSEPTAIVDGNQLSMEYRFFNSSTPANPDRERELTIWQAATDQHELYRAFKTIYGKNWLATGGSKGGMTATYYRRFYPADMNGTVPYVAPNDVVDSKDSYNAFLDRVGTDPACRARLGNLERRVLSDRSYFLDKVNAKAAADGLTFTIVGSADKSMEASTVDMTFGFWQYTGQAGCASLPDPATISNQQVWDFFEDQAPLTGYSDQELTPYITYYYQAAYQLGSPEPYEKPLNGLLRYPGLDVAKSFVPKEIAPRYFDKRAMPDVDQWVRTRSTNMLYIYGEVDPWSAEPFTCGKTAARRNCYSFTVPGGTHGSKIAQLPTAQRDAATKLVLKWAGLSDTAPSTASAKSRVAHQRTVTGAEKPN